jgi:hypothetical protein
VKNSILTLLPSPAQGPTPVAGAGAEERECVVGRHLGAHLHHRVGSAGLQTSLASSLAAHRVAVHRSPTCWRPGLQCTKTTVGISAGDPRERERQVGRRGFDGRRPERHRRRVSRGAPADAEFPVAEAQCRAKEGGGDSCATKRRCRSLRLATARLGGGGF